MWQLIMKNSPDDFSYQNCVEMQSRRDPEDVRRFCAADAAGELICRCAGSGRSLLHLKVSRKVQSETNKRLLLP